MKRIVFIDPRERDDREFQHLRSMSPTSFSCIYHTVADYTVSFDITDTYTPLVEEIEAICNNLEDISIDGIIATNDYPGQSISCIVAHTLGLPGPNPQALLPLQDKYYARKVQNSVVPEATPVFETISSDKPCLQHVSLPCIVKPIKGAGSLGTMYIRSEAELDALSEIPHLYFQPLHDLLAEYTDYHMDDAGLLVEEYAPGTQVTVDGFIRNGSVSIIGIVDSEVDPYTLQFNHFSYPSQLPDAVQQRMHEIVTTLVQSSGLDNTFFNVECRYDTETDRITIIEMNTRMSSQFADMYEKVDGFHPYQVAIDIACGNTPQTTYRTGKHRHVKQFCIHTDADYFVEEVPTPHEKSVLYREFPDMRIEVEVEPGKRMSDCDNAVFIYGYTMVTLGGNDEDDCDCQFEYVRNRLRYRFSR